MIFIKYLLKYQGFGTKDSANPPANIPILIARPRKIPTFSQSLGSATVGAMQQHIVYRYPFENAKTTRFINLTISPNFPEEAVDDE